MKRLYTLLILLAVCAACSRQDPVNYEPFGKENPARQSVLPGRAEIMITEQAAEGFSPDAFIREAAPLGVISVERIFPDAGEFEARHRAAGLHRWYRVRYDEDIPVTKAQAGLSSLPGVQAVEFPHRKERRSYFNDPYFEYQWHFLNDVSSKDMYAELGIAHHFKKGIDINVEPVWKEFTAGSKDVIVAVIDGGIDLSHEDLQGVVLSANEGSRSFVTASSEIPADDHGTHVGGTIGAINNNGKGVCGIAGGKDGKGGVRLMSLAIFLEEEEDGYGYVSTKAPEFGEGDEDAQALVWAADHGAVIANNSWGYVAESEREASQLARDFLAYPSATKTAIDYFIDNAGLDANGNQTGPMKGGVVFFASGNDGWSHDAPSEYDRVIAVGSFGPDGKMAEYSNYGSWVDILAPGGSDRDEDYAEEWIASTGAGGDYFYMSGTSMACPHASGVAALLVSHFGGPGFTNEDLKEMLLGGARTDVIEMPRGRTVGGGMLDAYGAFTYQQGTPGPDKPDIKFSTDYTGDYRIKSHETVDINYTISGNEKARLSVDVTSDCPGLTATCSTSRAALHIEALKAQPGEYSAVIRVGDAATKAVPFTILENHAPVLTAPIDDQIVNAASSGFTSVDLSQHFRDPDGEVPTYSVSVSQAGVISSRLSGNNLSLGAEGYGLVKVTVTATDARGASCPATFLLLARDAFQEFDIFPNPVSDYLYVRPGKDRNLDISLYNQAGGLVYASGSAAAGPFNPVAIDLRDQPGGTYALFVAGRRYTIAKK